ncbi:YaiO family outer membrane beta-barrel protein [Leptolyngbya sp. 15MV]|nr:YaiO family outer membrane beta-barrel protein [Leptolyngbya sp. 15MV]
MIARLLVGLALCTAAPTLAQGDNPYSEAVAARLAGDPARAEALLAPWVESHPGDVDARLQLAYARLALDKLDEAEADFRRVLAAAPDYADARSGLDLVAARRGERSGQRGFLFVEAGLSDVSGAAAEWREIALGALVPLDRRVMLDVRGAHYRRFGLTDMELEAGATVHAAPDLWLRLGGSATPGADFRPRWGLRAGLDRRIPDGTGATVVGIDVHHRAFPAQDVTSIEPHVTRYFGDGGFSMTVRGSGLFAEGGGFEPGVLVRADLAPRDRTRFFLGGAVGADTELGVVTTTRSLFAGGELPLGARLSLTLGAAREWRGDGIDRSEGRVGLKLGL